MKMVIALTLGMTCFAFNGLVVANAEGASASSIESPYTEVAMTKMEGRWMGRLFTRVGIMWIPGEGDGHYRTTSIVRGQWTDARLGRADEWCIMVGVLNMARCESLLGGEVSAAKALLARLDARTLVGADGEYRTTTVFITENTDGDGGKKWTAGFIGMNRVQGKHFYGSGLSSLNFKDASHVSNASEGGGWEGRYVVVGNEILITIDSNALRGAGETFKLTLRDDGKALLFEGEEIYFLSE